MPKIVPIVEGDGEVDAVPKLLSKLLREKQRWDIQVTRARNAHGCENLKKHGGLESFIELAWREQDCAGVLVLMDADRDCPRTLAEDFVKRIKAIGVRRTVVVVIAKSEYEAWFLASLESIVASGQTALPAGLVYPDEVEDNRNVKGWLSMQMPPGRSYKETLDQSLMTTHLELEHARQNSRSFRRLCHAVEEMLEAIDSGSIFVTPAIVAGS